MTRPLPMIQTPPFNPIHDGLYVPGELLAGYDPARPESVVDSLDYRCFAYFQQQGRTVVADPYAGMMQATHDASVARGMHAFLTNHLKNGRRPVAIMGGHRELRGSPTYRAVAKIAKLLSEYGFVVASGGGPGCMEATHLGALFAHAGDAAMDDAIARLAAADVAALPKDMDKVLVRDKDTGQWLIDEEKAVGLARWMEPARQIANERADALIIDNQSLAVPTWHYGHEPFTPLATHVAKYFLNSIREDVLLALASSGIIYSEGRGGTLQEVFQDAAQVYYRGAAPITSMVFYDSGFWTAPAQPDTSEHPKVRLPVADILFRLFVHGGKMTEDEFKRFVRIVDDASQVVKIIIDNAPPLQQVVDSLAAIGMPELTPDDMNAGISRIEALAAGQPPA